MRCPPEDVDGHLDGDGCLDADNDEDGIADVDDSCPCEPEDLDGFEDEGGCPDPDNDGDSILDPCDQCPDEPETWNGHLDEDGCPDHPVAFSEERIEIVQYVRFGHRSMRVRSAHDALLDAVAEALEDNPQILRIAIVGHAAQNEPDAARLSVGRASAVRDALVSRGVDPARLEVRGDGREHPLDPGESEAGRALNRRVEFAIVDVEERVRPTPETPPPTVEDCNDRVPEVASRCRP